MNQPVKYALLCVLGMTVVAGLQGCNSKPVVEGTPPMTDTSNRNTGTK